MVVVAKSNLSILKPVYDNAIDIQALNRELLRQLKPVARLHAATVACETVPLHNLTPIFPPLSYFTPMSATPFLAA
jgi:hypothetical protein